MEHKSESAQAETTEATGIDPRDTEHPTGAAQAAENAETDPPA
ncbi:hypothetical protein BH09ACT7_BH09ACT7_29340 [soil metagenome]